MVRAHHPLRRSGLRLVIPAVVLLSAFAVPGIMLLTGPGEPAFNGVDTGWQAYTFTLHSPFWDNVNVVLNALGYVGVLVLHAILAIALLLRQRPMAALFAAASGITVLALTQLAKAVVGRDRPEGAKVLSDTGSYPSGHVSATTAFLVVVTVLIGRWWMTVLAAIGVAAMMFSRTYLSAHWLSDVLGGACLATGTVLFLWWLMRDICTRENAQLDGTTLWTAGASQRQQAAGQEE